MVSDAESQEKRKYKKKKRLRDNNKPQFAALGYIRRPCAPVERPKFESNRKKGWKTCYPSVLSDLFYIPLAFVNFYLIYLDMILRHKV